ncbi:MAG: ABC transporter ATP-binding protein [Cyclobacteriaceae bacterium]|nr:ABC transporter ATP-binding protein [Cyclobacteriaceae bacterium]
MTHASLAIKTVGLSYQFSTGVTTLNNLDMEVKRGEIYGFLGPNGSGKTTTLSLLLGLIRQQQGSIELFGQLLSNDRMKILKRVGSLIEAPSLYGHLTARENIEVYRGIYGMPPTRTSEILNIVGLADTGSKRVKKFSLGMKQRLSIALALLPNPELLILDEPTNGLDPNGMIELRELIKTLNKEHGVTVLISSHILAEVEKIVSHVGIIANGRLVFQGSLDELQQQAKCKLLIRTSDNEKAAAVLEHYKPEKVDSMLSIDLMDDFRTGHINRMLIDNQLQVFSMYPQNNNLEQLFLDLTTKS